MATWMLIVFLYQGYGSYGHRQYVVVPGFVTLEGCQQAYKAMQEVEPNVSIKGSCVKALHRG